MARLMQSHTAKERVNAQAVSFFSTNETVLTALTASFTGMSGLHESTRTLDAMKEGVSRSLETLAEVGGKVQEEAVRAGYGPTVRADAVQRLVDSVVDFQVRSREIVEEMRVHATKNAEEIRDAVEDGKRRLASWPRPARSDGRAVSAAGAAAGTREPEVAGGQVPLDEVMLAMDVVDTLRHRQQLVEQELAGGDRDAQMLERLRRIYAAQGIDVPDHVLADGVAALREDRFAYRPPPPGPAVAWARLYVSRGRWGRALLAVAAVLALAWFAYQQTVVAPRGVGGRLTEGRAAVAALARDAAAVQRADDLAAAGRGALAAGDDAEARRAVVALGELREQLERAYELRIVVGDDVTSGVWRMPDANPAPATTT
jgi:hypothetical protein